MIFARVLSVVSLVIASLLSGCGGAEPNVQYSGTALIIEGVTYTRRTPAEINLPGGIYEEGVVYVGEKPGQRAALETRLDELGLTDRQRYEAISHFIVRIPKGWEDQWVRALLVEPQVQYAWINFGILCC